MSESARMNLKILYSIESGDSSHNTYLTRSKAPQDIKVVSLPNDDVNVGSESKIGIVQLEVVLNQVFASSPELLYHKLENEGFDYNIYYRDTCESDEPLVSLGFLSEIKVAIQNLTHNGYDEESEELFVTGRVCKNFASLLSSSYRKPTSTSKNSMNVSPCSETLEVKLQFSKIISLSNPGKSNNRFGSANKRPSIDNTATSQYSTRNASENSSSAQYPAPVSTVVQPIINRGPVPVTKRQVNSMSAPKAKRTLSLPIWEPKQTLSSNLTTDSIAHKIFMLDRKNDFTNDPKNAKHDRMASTIKNPDSVSKRFNFMQKKKKPSQTKSTKKTAQKACRMNTTPIIAESEYLIKENSKSSKSLNTKNKSEIPTYVQEEFDDLLKYKTPDYNVLQNKENIDPSTENQNQNLPLDFMSLTDESLKNNFSWLESYNLFSPHPTIPPQVGAKTSSTTPNDANTCNSIAFNDDENDNNDIQTFNINSVPTSEIDKTSPAETDLPPRDQIIKKSKSSRSNLLADIQQIDVNIGEEEEEEEDESNDVPTSEMNTYSTSVSNTPLPTRIPLRNKQPAPNRADAMLEKSTARQQYMDEDFDAKHSFKKQKTMPSSPVTMMNMQEKQHYDDLSVTNDKDDLFSSFIHNKTLQKSTASTPNTNYDSHSSDALEDFKRL